MTDTPAPVAAPEPAAPAGAAAGPVRKPRKRRWRRRLKRIALVVLLLVVALRVSLVFIVPVVLRKVAEAYDLTCTYDRLDMNLLATDLGLWRLRVTPKQASAAVVQVEYIRGDVSPFALLAGRLHVFRAEADGVDLVLDREPDGRIAWLDPFLHPPAAPASPPPPPSREAQALNFSAPLKVDAFRLRSIRAHFSDRSVSPPLDVLARLNFSVSDVGDPVRPVRFEIELLADPVLDYFRIEGDAKSTDTTLDADLRLLVRGVHPQPAAGYLRALGIEPRAERLELRATGGVRLRLLTPQTLPAAAVPPPALAGQLTIRDVSATADGQEWFGVDRLAVDLEQLSPVAATVSQVVLDGLTCRATRTAGGTILAAGFELVGAPTPAASATSPATMPAVASAPASAAAPAPPPFPWRINALHLRNCRAEFRDESLAPPADVALILDDLTVHNLGLDPAQPDAAVDLVGRLRVPGVMRTLTLTASVKPQAVPAVLDAQLAADGVQPILLEPYLERAGLESQLKDGRLALKLHGAWQTHADGRLAAALRLEDMDFRDGTPLLASKGVRVTGVEMDPRTGAVRVEAVEVDGPQLAVRREASGALALLGLRIRSEGSRPPPRERAVPSPGPAVVDPPSGATPAQRATSPPAPDLPPISIARFSWTGLNVLWQDETVQPAVSLSISDAGVEVTGLDLDLSRPDAEAKPAALRAWLAVPGLLDRLDAQGSILPGSGQVRAEVNLAGRGLTGGPLAPYLKPTGVEPLLTSGDLRAHAVVTAEKTGPDWRLSLTVDDTGLVDGGRELFGVDRVRVQDVVQRVGEVDVGDVEVVRPRVRVEREAAGTLVVSGIRLGPPTAPRPEAARGQGGTHKAPMGAEDAALMGRPTLDARRPASPEAPPVTTLGRLSVKEAGVLWADRAVAPAVDATVTASLSLDGLTVGRPAPPAKVSLTARVPGSVEEFTVSGTVSPAPDAPAAALTIAGRGLRAGPLAPYLPPGVQVTMRDGRLRAALDVGMGPLPQGGQRAHVHISDVLLTDAGAPAIQPAATAGAPLLKLDSLRLDVSRWDEAAGILAIDEVSAGGLELDVAQTQDQSLSLLGLALGGKAEGSASRPEAPHPPSGATSPPRAAAPEAAPAADPPKPPLITLEQLDLQVRRVSVHDRTRLAAAPLSITDLRLRNLGRIECLGPDAANRPPVKLQLTGRIEPVVDRLRLDLQAAPFSTEPSVEIDLLVSGIRGAGVNALLPEIESMFDGSTLTAGEFHVAAELSARLPRRSPLDFDLARGADARFLVKDVAFRDSPGGAVLVGLKEWRGDGVQVLPANRGLRIKSLELTSPIGRAWRDDAGLHVLGCTLLTPPPTTTQPTSANVTPTAPTPEVAHPPSGATSPPGAAAPQAPVPDQEFTIDLLTIAGVDLHFEDRTVKPHFILPLTGLDVEVRNASTLALTENRPVRFSLLANSGKVPLPKRQRGAGMPGAVGDAFSLLTGTHATPTAADTEDRELFSQVTGSGRLSLYPAPNGWAKLALNGLDLAALHGLAATQGIILDGGLLDFSADVRFHDNGDLEARTRTVLTDLQIAEPPNGPIVRHLALPAPLDAVIVALRDADGSITLPISVPVENSQVSVGAVTRNAVSAIGRVTATALASAPLKAAAAVGSLIGLPSGPKTAHEEQFIFDFAPGTTALGPADAARLDAIARRVRGDGRITVSFRHELGLEDAALAQTRANPGREECLALARRLEARRLELTALRQRLAGEGQAQLASSAPQRLVTLERLRQVDVELARTDDSLDWLYDLCRPGAERQADRRTRAALLAIGQERLDTVRSVFSAPGGSAAGDASRRVHAARATINPRPDSAGGRISMTLTGPHRSRDPFTWAFWRDLF